MEGEKEKQREHVWLWQERCDASVLLLLSWGGGKVVQCMCANRFVCVWFPLYFVMHEPLSLCFVPRVHGGGYLLDSTSIWFHAHVSTTLTA
jgi:hypothetical protein